MNSLRFAHVIVTVAWLFFLAGLGDAEESNIRPTAPLVSPIPPACEWTMKVRQPRAELSTQAPTAERPATVKELLLTRLGNVQRVILTTTDDKTQEFYHFNGHYLLPTAVPGRIVVSSFVSSAPPYPYCSPGFYGLDWIKLEFFIDVTNYGNVKCFHYKGNRNPLAGMTNLPSEALSHSTESTYEAWIDFNTGLPVAVLINDELLEYTFGVPPDHLELPPAYLGAWRSTQSELTRLEAMKVR